jgi:SAM-dependent methyltransferase
MSLPSQQNPHEAAPDNRSNGVAGTSQCTCAICGYSTHAPNEKDVGIVRGNTARFINSLFHIWKCPQCGTIYSIDPMDFRDVYTDYPLNKRQLDFFARMSMRNLLKRLKRAGLGKNDAILDYGCGNGLFVAYLKERGYSRASGYDPWVQEFSVLPGDSEFDCLICNDVIEHIPDPRSLIQECVKHLKSGGLLYIGTCDSSGVELDDLEPHIMRLHQPFHRVIFSEKTLHALASETELELIHSYTRSYMDTLIPFANYRFLDEFSRALGHNMDRMLDPKAAAILFHKPRLWLYGFAGYFFPSAYEPAVVLRRRTL